MALKRNDETPHARFSGMRKLYQKIGYGYFVAIAIGFVGSLTGMLVADYYQGQSIEQIWEAQAQSQLLQNFERTASELHLYTTRLAVMAKQPEQLQQAQAEDLEAYVKDLHAHKQAIEQFLADDPVWIATDPADINALVQTYTDELDICITTLQNQLETIPTGDEFSLSNALSAKLNTIAIGDTAERIDQFHQELQALVAVARAQELQAGHVMETAQGFEKLMIVVSMLLSAAIASVIAWRTSRAIAGPIERVTDVAQRVAKNSDFSLRVNITTADEIGMLAAALNRLIQRMQVRTDSLNRTAQRAKAQAHELEQTLKTLQQTQAQMIQAEKMSSLGQMVAGIAHEINNPVSFIYGNLDYAKRYVNDLLYLIKVYQQAVPMPPAAVQQCQEAIEYEFLQEDLPKLLASLEIGAERIRSIVLSLRIFSRLNEANIKPINLQNNIDSTLVILNHRLKEQPDRPAIELVKNYSDLPLVECYAGQLNQVFTNILANAIDALEEKWIAVKDTQPDWRPKLEISTQAHPKHRVSITIRDNGPGIPEEVRQKIFDPFFTTKAVGKGTGLGMSISYEIVVDKHGGQLILDSSPTGGTSFVIELPQKVDPTAAAIQPAESGAIADVG
ncbi:MAG: ATP-binding protein [Cyanobacteria bacterium P01_A01_bin.123]